MSKFFRLYIQLVGVAIKSRIQYKSDFLVGVISVIVMNVVNLSLIWVLLRRFQTIQGWNYWEVAILYSMWLIIHSVYSVFFWHLSLLEEDIIKGDFDKYLIRTCGTFLQFLAKEVNYMGVGDLLIGIAVFTLAYHNLHLQWELGHWSIFVLAVLSGIIIETSIVLMFGTLSFWTGRSYELFRLSLRFNLFTQQYPIDIFGQWYQIFVTIFLPVAFVNYYPLTLLLGKNNGLGLSFLPFLSPVVAVALAGLAAILWHRGVAAYTSSGN